MPLILPTEKHHELHQKLTKLMQEVAAIDCTELEVLAIASALVGQTLALQDRSRPKDYYMQIVVRNIESGNAHAIEQITGFNPGRA